MVILDKPLPIPTDVIQIDHASNPTSMKRKFGTLRKNTSKNELWVLQSSRQEAKWLLESVSLEGASLKYDREAICEMMETDLRIHYHFSCPQQLLVGMIASQIFHW